MALIRNSNELCDDLVVAVTVVSWPAEGEKESGSVACWVRTGRVRIVGGGGDGSFQVARGRMEKSPRMARSLAAVKSPLPFILMSALLCPTNISMHLV